MLFKNLLFTIIIVTGIFTATELVLALAGVRPLLLTEDPLVGFADNVPQFIKATREDGAAMYITPENKLPLFNFQEFAQHKDNNAYRVFCVGGSTTFGRPYQDKLSFCGWLRAYLQAADPSRQWEVINAGGISYASYRVARVMNELRNYQPDLFIVYSGQNEFLEQRSYGALQELPAWITNLDATLSGTRVYTAMKQLIDALRPSGELSLRHDQLDVEVDDILNHTLGPKSYHRDEAMRQRVITHYRLNLQRMAKIADSVEADIVYVMPVINIKDMSPFKSEHSNDLDLDALMQWQTLYNEARELQQAGRPDEALVKYRQALAIDNRYAELHYSMGQVLFEQLRYDESETAFRRAVEEDVAPLRILSSMQAIIAQVADDEDAKLIDFSAIMRRAYLEAHGHALFGSEFFTDHVHPNVEGYRMLGMALLEHLLESGIARADDSWNAAAADRVRYNILADIDTNDVGMSLLSLGAVMEWAGKFEEARALLLRALDILGPAEDICMRLASSSYALGRLDDASAYLKDVQALSPGLPGLHSKLGMIRLEQGYADEAIEYCTVELGITPENHMSYACIANAMLAQGHTEKAQAYFDTALKLGPDSVFVQLSYADFLIGQHRFEEALAHGREALLLNPVHHKAHNTVASVLIRLGDLEQARLHTVEALRLEPGYEDARNNLQLLQAGLDSAGQRQPPPREM